MHDGQPFTPSMADEAHESAMELMDERDRKRGKPPVEFESGIGRWLRPSRYPYDKAMWGEDYQKFFKIKMQELRKKQTDHVSAGADDQRRQNKEYTVDEYGKKVPVPPKPLTDEQRYEESKKVLDKQDKDLEERLRGGIWRVIPDGKIKDDFRKLGGKGRENFEQLGPEDALDYNSPGTEGVRPDGTVVEADGTTYQP